MDAGAYLEERAALLEPFLDAALPPADAPPARLHAAMRHLLFPGGKRLRPGFVFAGCEVAGAPPERALPLAAAVELVHTYSLVHDDLPCMDDDALRRGRPTVHVAFDEATAVLAGDALLARAFEVLVAPAAAEDPGRTLAAVAALARAAGSGALVGGQSDDLAFAPGGGDEAARVESVHRRKSAALFAAATSGGALLGGAGSELVARLARFGENVGVAFQIADDLLDRGDGEACSLVAALGAEGAQARAEALLEEALDGVSGLGARAEPLRELARHAVRRTR